MNVFCSALALILAAGSLHAQPPALINAEIIDRSSIDDPAEAVRQTENGWFAFSIPAIEGTRSPCCWKGNWKRSTEFGCSLERDSRSYGTMSTSPLEEYIIAYVNVAEGEVKNLRIAGAQCPMDAGGQTVAWIGEPGDRDSLDWFEELARSADADGLDGSALWALALHASDGASDRLRSLAQESHQDLAQQSIFWLGEARGGPGYEALKDLLDTMPAGEIRRHINFALSQNSLDRATRLLADIAREDHDPEQRADALFWLAQEHPAVAEDIILDVIENEQDDEILERAVFALSQLPPETSGPALLALVRNNEAPREVRRQAMFWLAHEGDEQSVQALTDLITH